MKNLRATLSAAGSTEAVLPTNAQLGDWLRRCREQAKDTLDRDINVVAALRLEVNALPHCLPKELDAMFLLKLPIVSDSEVCVSFACPGMLSMLNWTLATT